MRRKTAGVTLLEVLLVMVIASSILLMVIGYMQTRTDEIRRNRAALQMQQILNAGLAYYVANYRWPSAMSDLTSGGYLPATPSTGPKNPWGADYTILSTSGVSLFYVYSDVKNNANAQIIAGRLPLAYVASAAGSGSPPSAANCATTATTCYAVASVNVPGQNLNNATAVTFAGFYKSGACVPEPTCPVDKDGNTMTPQIYVVPASVSGLNDKPTCTNNWLSSSCQPPYNSYPISSYTASAMPSVRYAGGASGPYLCGSTTNGRCIYNSGSQEMPTNIKYWRVCLSVTTEKGVVSPDVPAWGQLVGSVLVITRCMPSSESSNHSYADFNVWERTP